MPKKKDAHTSSKMQKAFGELTLLSDGEFNPNAKFELLTTAKQTDPRYGVFNFSKKQLEELADNFNAGALGRDVPVDINHDPDHKAFAWLQPGSAFVAPSKKLDGEFSLFASLHRFTPEGEKMLRDGAFRYFSLQIKSNFERMIDGVKKKFSNIIYALALTNTPVIKDMAPTFSDSYFSNTNPMKMFEAILTSLSEKERVTSEEKKMLRTAFLTLSEEEQEEVKEQVEEVEAKPEEEGGADDDGEKKEDGEEKGDDKGDDGEEKEDDDEDGEEEVEMSEKVLAEVKSLKEENAKLAKKLDMQELSEAFSNEMVLSETKPVGFHKEEATAVVEFMVSLSEGQRKTFRDLISKIRGVDLSEYGSSSASAVKELSEESVVELSDKLMAEGKAKNITEAQEMAEDMLSKK